MGLPVHLHKLFRGHESARISPLLYQKLHEVLPDPLFGRQRTLLAQRVQISRLPSIVRVVNA